MVEGQVQSVKAEEAEMRKLSFQRSHLWDCSNANTVDEGTFENLALL